MEDKAEADFNFLLMEVGNLTTEHLKEVQTLCENKLKERESKDDTNSK